MTFWERTHIHIRKDKNCFQVHVRTGKSGKDKSSKTRKHYRTQGKKKQKLKRGLVVETVELAIVTPL